MNWTNYDRLVRHLETMPPEMFNYNHVNIEMDDDEPACVACQCRILSGVARPFSYAYPQRFWDFSVIETFLEVDRSDAMYLYIPGDRSRAIGSVGIHNALSRLRTVAAKYPCPTTPEPVTQFVADDAAFLSACRAMASQPIEVEAE